jgi:hypothetical protein
MANDFLYLYMSMCATIKSDCTEKHEDTERDEGRRYEQRESRTRSATWCSRTDALRQATTR